jgi:hypothetical protein
MRGTLTAGSMACALSGLAGAVSAQPPPGPESPPPPWFVVADMPSADARIAITRWLWNREARTLRYCRKSAATGAFSCAPDVILPAGRWVLQRIQTLPSSDLDSSARFFSPDLDRTLNCRATVGGEFSCN